mgnify:CR=1 FL=1
MAGQLDERRPSPSTGSLLRRWVTPVAVLALALVTGVAALREADIEVSAVTGRLAVTVDGQVDNAAVLAAVDEAGYEAIRS